MENSKRVLIFVPGLYGSTLVEEKTGRVEFANIPRALLGRTRLALPIAGLQKRTLSLRAGKILDRVKIVSPVLVIDGYEGVLKQIKRVCDRRGVDIVTLAWDWRKEPLEGAKAIAKKIESLKQGGAKDVFVFGHSYGALAASYFFRYGTQAYEGAKETWEGLQQISGALLATSPYGGSNVVFRNIIQGAKLAERFTVIPQVDYSTFDAAYFLMPRNGRMDLFEPNLERAKVEILAVETWERAKWGLFSDRARRKHRDSSQIRTHLQRVLGQKGAFDRAMNSALQTKPLTKAPLVTITATGYQTLDRGVWLEKLGRPDIVAFDARDLSKLAPAVGKRWGMIDGDGTISTQSQRPPAAIAEVASHNMSLKHTHLEVLASKEVLSALEETLSE